MLDQSPKGLFVVVDEAHHGARRATAGCSACYSWQAVSYLDCPQRRFGWSRTMQRLLWTTFEEIIYQISKKRLIEIGVLSSPTIETVETNVEFERDFTKADYDHIRGLVNWPKVLESDRKHGGRNHLIAEHYAKNSAKFGKTIVFAVDILHARTLAHEFEKIR